MIEQRDSIPFRHDFFDITAAMWTRNDESRMSNVLACLIPPPPPCGCAPHTTNKRCSLARAARSPRLSTTLSLELDARTHTHLLLSCSAKGPHKPTVTSTLCSFCHRCGPCKRGAGQRRRVPTHTESASVLAVWRREDCNPASSCAWRGGPPKRRPAAPCSFETPPSVFAW